MDKTLLPSQGWDTKTPVYVNKKFKNQDPSDHSFSKSSCILKKCRVTALFVNLIKNLLELMRKEEQIKPRLNPYAVETISSWESMPYAPNRVRGRKARPRCLLCPGAQHSTCIPRRRVLSMTPAGACCKVGKCYKPPTDFRSPCLPPPSNICPFHRHPPCTMRPCQKPTTPGKSKFPHKRESYMHTPCDPCGSLLTLQCGGCVSVTQLPPRYPRPIPSMEPVPSCYDCPALAPCQSRCKPRAKPRLSRPNLCKRQCVLNPCKRQISSLECSGQRTAGTTTEVTNAPQRVSSRHSSCPRTERICIQQEVNTDKCKYCISTQTSIAVFPEARCGPSFCSTSHPKVAQTEPTRVNVVSSCPSQQINARRSQVQFNQAVQMESENVQTRIEVSGPKNCSCQASCEPVVPSGMYQPLATGVFIRFPDMVTDGCYGVPAVIASNYPMGGTGCTGGTIQDPSPPQREQFPTTDPVNEDRMQCSQPSCNVQAPPRRNSSDETGPAISVHRPQIQEPQQVSQETPAPQDSTHSVRWATPLRTNLRQDLNGAYVPPDPYKPQATSIPSGPQGSNGSLGQYMGMPGPTGPYGPQSTGPYDSQLQPDAARGAYGPQSLYTSGVGLSNANNSYGNTSDGYHPQSPTGIIASSQHPGQRQVNSGLQPSDKRDPFGRPPHVYGPQGQVTPPTDAYDPRFVSPRGNVGAYDPKSRLVSPNVAHDPQSGAYGQIGRPGPHFGMENNTSNKVYGQSPDPDGLSNQYGPQSTRPVGTNETNKLQTSYPKTRFIGVDESSSQTETYGGVNGPVSTSEPDNSHSIELDTTDAGGQTSAYGQPVSTDTPGYKSTAQDKRDRKSVTPTNEATGSKSKNRSQAQKTICKPKRFYCTQSGQAKAKYANQAVDAEVAGVRFQEQSEAVFDDQDDSEVDIEPVKLSTMDQEQYSQSNRQRCEFSAHEAEKPAVSDPNTTENNSVTSFMPRRKSVNYSPQEADIRYAVTPESESIDAFRPEAGRMRLRSEVSPKFSQERVQRRQTKNPTALQRKLTADAELEDYTEQFEAPTESQEFSEQLKLSDRRKSTTPNSIRQHHGTADTDINQATKRISSNASQRTIKIKPFPKSPLSSRTSSAERTNVPTTKRPSMPPTQNKSVKGQSNQRASVPRKLDVLPAKKRNTKVLKGPDNESRSASPQRKVSNQSQGSGQSKTSKRKFSNIRKSEEKVGKAKELVFDHKIDVKAPEDDRAARGVNRYRSSYDNQDTWLSDSETPNIRQQKILKPPPTSDSNTYGLRKPHHPKRRGSDLGGILPCQGSAAQDYQQLCEYSSGEEGDHGTSDESIDSNTASIGEEIICKKLSEKIICIKSSGTDPVADAAPCWSHRLGSVCRPITRLHPHRPRLLSPCDSACRKGLNNDCFIPPCHRNLPSQKRPRVTVHNRPPWQNINSGRNARRPSNPTAVQPLPPCQRIPPWPEPCPGRITSALSPCQSSCQMSSRHRTQINVSCRCTSGDESRRSTESLECRKGREEGYPCSMTPSLTIECHCPSKGSKECKCPCFFVASSLQRLRQDRC